MIDYVAVLVAMEIIVLRVRPGELRGHPKVNRK